MHARDHVRVHELLRRGAPNGAALAHRWRRPRNAGRCSQRRAASDVLCAHGGCGSGQDEAAVSPDPAQTWHGGEPRPGADVAAVPAQRRRGSAEARRGTGCHRACRRHAARCVGRNRRYVPASGHICTGTGLAPAHICTGTGLAPAHICAGTGLAPMPHLRRDVYVCMNACTYTCMNEGTYVRMHARTHV